MINLEKTYEKLCLAARAIVAIENPQDIIAQSARPYGQVRTACGARTCPRGVGSRQAALRDWRRPRAPAAMISFASAVLVSELRLQDGGGPAVPAVALLRAMVRGAPGGRVC